MPRKSVRDLLVFFGLTVFIVAHFWLQNYPDTEFFLTLTVLSLFIIVLLKHYHKDREFPFDFDENLTAEKWGWIILCAIVIYGINYTFSNVIVAAGFTFITVPVSAQPMSFVSLQFPTYVNDMLFNITLVAPGEELCKLVTITVLFLFSANYRWISKKGRLYFSVALPVGFWAVLHTYGSPQFVEHPLFVLPAFLSGVVLVWLLHKTQSILAAILSHGFHNCFIIVITVFFGGG